MTNIDEKMEQVLGIPAKPITGEIITVEPNNNSLPPLPPVGPQKSEEEVQDEKDIKDDYEYSREALKDIVEQGRTALSELSSVAQQSQHPRAYEAVAVLLKNLSDAVKGLMELQKDKKILKPPKVQQQMPMANTNIAFFGTPQQLQDMLKKPETEDDVPTD